MNNRFPFKSLAFAFFLLMTSKGASAKPVTWFDGIHAVSLSVPRGVDPVVDIASDMFRDDMKQVTGIAAQRTGLARQATIRLCQLDRLSRRQQRELRDMGVPVEKLQTLTDGFHICVLHGQIVVVGANGRGTAYGLLELSRQAGVSPWVWWGDVVPEHRSRLTIDDQFTTTQGASVEYRGIFLNDEDWTLRPWSYGHFDKAPFGVIGMNTYKKVFLLLLRLRANAIWPAMHPGTVAFFQTPGAKAMADSCGIAIGSSHCEPLLRNNVGEWNIDCVNGSTLDNHYREWLCRQFGNQTGDALFPAMHEYFRLCGERHPEFMGWNQTEVSKDLYDRGLSPVRNSEFSQTEFGDELDGYLNRFAAVAERIRKARALVRPELQDAYFAAIEYPVCAAEAHTRKMLWAQKARQLANGTATKDMFAHQSELYHACAESQQAYQEVRALTEFYNEKMAGGKWRRSMNMRPRGLPVFGAPVLPTLLTDAQVQKWLKKGRKSTDRKLSDWSDTLGVVARNAADWQHASPGTKVIEMLGHSMRAVALPQGGDVTYAFSTDRDGNRVLRVALIPTQPNDKGDLRFSVSIDGGQPTVFSLKDPFRSERWKLNVLRGQAVHELLLKGLKAGCHTLTFHALDPHIVLDQWMVDSKANRRFYLFPVRQTF